MPFIESDVELSLLFYGPLVLLSLLLLNRIFYPGRHSYPNIPAIGPTAPLLYYYGAIKFLFKGNEMVQEGYVKYKGSAFKVPELFNWHIVVSGPKLIEELRKAGDDELNFDEATAEILQTDHTLGPAIHLDTYHISVIRSRLTRNLGLLFSDMHHELVASFNDVLPPSDGWQRTAAYNAVMQVICRTSNRIFVGLPVCRNPEYIALNVGFATSVMIGSTMLRFFPEFLRPLAAVFVTNVGQTITQTRKHLEATIDERLRMEREYGRDWPGKPNDLLSWLMDEAKGEERDIRDLVLRVLTLNFASIHTSSMSLTHAVYHIAANPEYADVMRKEVAQAVMLHGWSKEALDKMPYLDSFLRESHRFNGLGSTTMARKAMKDFTFSDGTFIPKGGFVSVVERPMHRDGDHYEHPDVFIPWRFVEKQNGSSESGGAFETTKIPRYGVVSTSSEYVTFGHGKHACPGRFFAANELKAMLAHLVMNYDIKMENDGVIPEPLQFGMKMIPNPKGEIMFRHRKAQSA